MGVAGGPSRYKRLAEVGEVFGTVSKSIVAVNDFAVEVDVDIASSPSCLSSLPPQPPLAGREDVAAGASCSSRKHRAEKPDSWPWAPGAAVQHGQKVWKDAHPRACSLGPAVPLLCQFISVTSHTGTNDFPAAGGRP